GRRVPGREPRVRRPPRRGPRRAAADACDVGPALRARRRAARPVRGEPGRPDVRRPRARPPHAAHRPRASRGRGRATAQVPRFVRITALDTVVVGAEMRNWVFVKVSTDEGLVGWGEATVEWKTRAVVGCVEDYRSLLVGE